MPQVLPMSWSDNLCREAAEILDGEARGYGSDMDFSLVGLRPQ